MISTLKGDTVGARLWLPVQEVEEQAQVQIKNIASLPWVAHVAIMPDCHFGKGATVGSVIAMRGAVTPAAVGVDIGCGMAAVRTNIDPDKADRKAQRIFDALSSAIPVGFAVNESDVTKTIMNPHLAVEVTRHLGMLSGVRAPVADQVDRAWKQVGTLGGGNHFIEMCLDTDSNVWLMLHSGSRGIGKTIAEHHMAIARQLEHNLALKDKDLAAFLIGTPEMDAYRHDLYWAQEYARLNRLVMLDTYEQVLMEFWPGVKLEDRVSCHHNYVAEEVHFGEELFVTRKGAISADEGQMGIIPGSMGDKSYIVKGLGNADSLRSASHGAGRRMSRGAAKRKFTKKDLERMTEGVVCRKDADVIDEIPAAYKDIDKVMENQKDLVEVVAELKGFICVKG